LLLFSSAASFRRLPLCWSVVFLCAFLFGLLSAVLSSATYLSVFTAALCRPAVSLPLAAAAFALWFALSRVKPERLSRARRPYALALLIALLVGALALVLLNTLLRALPLGSLARYLHFSESWGTDRGKIWTFALRVYAELPAAQQLFGASSGALFHADTVSPLFSDAGLDAAHNEYLQYLVTNGALGLMSYLTALAFAMRAGFRRSKIDPIYHGPLLAVAAYALQAAVNIAQPMTTPLFFVLIGILISRKPEESSQV
jgi:O-antigen ligase